MSRQPVLVQQKDAAGGTLSTTHRQYRIKNLYSGMDGRRVRTAHVQRTETWLYDTAASGATENVSLRQVISDHPEHEPAPRTVTLAADNSTARAHLISEVERNGLGLVTSQTNRGVVDGGPGIETDSPIVTTTTWSLPEGDISRWNWRPSDVYVGTGAETRHTHLEYDSAGNLRRSYADLKGTLALVRSHEDSSREVAPTPADASQDGLNRLLSETEYDSWGNPVLMKGPNGRCTRISYDQAFNELPVSATVYTGGCGMRGITANTRFDRGLQLATMSIAPTGAVSTTEYDGYGRTTKMFAPDPALGIPEGAPSVKITYTDPLGGPYRKVQVERRDDEGTPRYRSMWSYVDGLGQTVASIQEADPAAGDQAPYIVSGRVRRDTHGRVVQMFEPEFQTVDPTNSAPPARSSTLASRAVEYDSFGRTAKTWGLDGRPTGKVIYHALSRETFDAADLAEGATPHPATTVQDGHGRVRRSARTTNQSGTADTLLTEMKYSTFGELQRIIRSHSASSDVYAREMIYDSWGRVVQNIEPNTAAGIGSAAVKAWRYAYNDAGDLVGTSDARGCGKNAQWDGAGRLLAEVYSPCLNIHPEYEDRPATRFIYDEPDAGQEGDWLSGKLAAIYDRAAHTQYSYDARGRPTSVARQIAIPNEDADPITEYAPHWFRSITGYDSANRVIAQSMGADVPELLGQAFTAGGISTKDLLVTRYTARGIAHRVIGSYGELILGKKVDADGFARRVEYGDEAKTVVTYEPTVRRTPARFSIQRPRPPIWDAPPEEYTAPSTTGSSPTAQTLLEDLHFDQYDPVDNLLLVNDARIEAEWPPGAKPVTRMLGYDDLNQLRRVDYATGDDVHVSPFAAEAEERDRSPIPEGPLANRVKWQSFGFDWQGNLTKSDDDSHAFFDRSMGASTHGTANNGPNRVVSAVLGDGKVDALYDPSGNLLRMLVTKKDADGDNVNLLFEYQWDEVGRLTRARRLSKSEIPLIDILGILVLKLDLGGIFGGRVDLRYTYDAGGARIVKSGLDRLNLERTYSIEVFPSLRLNHTRYIEGDDAYERTAETEAVYLVANGSAIGRVAYDRDGQLPRIGESRQHVYFTMTDTLGSTSVVIDKATSELVERSTYQAFGAPDTDYRPERWRAFREDYRFTGKEDDVGVGLTYFGARYYVPALGQWASADPLAIHSLGGGLNPYAYVFGSPQRLVDPTGLQAQKCEAGTPSCTGGGGNSSDLDLGFNAFLAAGETHARGGAAGGGREWAPNLDRKRVVGSISGFRAIEYQVSWTVSVPNYDCPPGDLCMDTVGVQGAIWTDWEANPDEVTGSGSSGYSDVGTRYGRLRERADLDWEFRKNDLHPDPRGVGDEIENAMAVMPLPGAGPAAQLTKGVAPVVKNGAKLENLAANEALRIQNAANRIKKPISVVGSRASGRTQTLSDWDYVIEGMNSKSRRSVARSLPGAGNLQQGERSLVDFRPGPVDTTKPSITFFPE